MGSIIKSKCSVCDYQNEFRFGGGRFDFQTNCPVPAINKETGEFVNINFYEYKNSSEYLFYHNEELKSQNSENVNQYQNFDLKINQKDNYCPECKNQTLDFYQVMFID